MSPSITKQTTPHSSVLTGRNQDASAAVVFDDLPEGLLSPQLSGAYTAVQNSTDTLMNTVARIVHNSHPDRVSDLIVKAISELFGKVFSTLIKAGVAESRAYQEAYDRVAVPAPATAANISIRSDYRRILMDGDLKGRMKLLGQADASVEFLAAAIEVGNMLQLPDSFHEEIQRRFVIVNAIETHSLAANAGLEPTPANPFQHGLDRAGAVASAERLIASHQAKLDALDTIEAATSRLVLMLAAVSGRSVDEVWTLVTGK